MLFKISLATSWRVMLLATLLVGTAISLATWILCLVQNQKTILPLIFVGLFYLISIWIHELAHVACYIWLAGNNLPMLQPQGTWGRAQICRKSLGILEDAVISIAGPLSGLLLLLPTMFFNSILDGNFLLIYPLLLLFLTHAVAMVPWHTDGAQIFSYILRGKLCYVDR